MKEKLIVLRLSSFLFIPFVVGCIFGNNNESNSKSVQPENLPSAFNGYVSLLDARGFTNKGVVFQSDVIGEFKKKASARRSLYSSLKAFEKKAGREMKCNFVSERQETSKGEVAAALETVSVGKLTIGTPEGAFDLPFNDQEGKYYAGLDSGKYWKKGIYSVKAEGSRDANGFEGSLSMPEVLEEGAVNGSLLDNGPVTLNTTALEVTWKKLSNPSDSDYILFQLYGQKQEAKLNLLCGIKESEATLPWRIPVDKTKDFTSDVTNGQIFIYRANLGRAEDPTIGRLDTEGLRLLISTFSIVE